MAGRTAAAAGVGAELAAVTVTQAFPNWPPVIWQVLFWIGIALMMWAAYSVLKVRLPTRAQWRQAFAILAGRETDSQSMPAPVVTERGGPKIRLGFGMNLPGCVVPTTFGTNAGQIPVRYFRLRVESDGGPVPQCAGRLLSIRRNGVTIFESEPLQLTFSPATQPDALAKEVRDGVPEYLDVLFLCAKGIILTTLKFFLPNSVDFKSLLAPQGLYSFEIAVTSSATKSAAKYDLVLDWRGNWETDAATGNAIT